MRTPGQSIVESVEEEGVMTMSTGHPAHARHIGQGRRGGGSGGQVDDPLAVGPGTGDPLAAALAYQQTVAGTSHILPARRSIPDGCRLVARVALHNMLEKTSYILFPPPSPPPYSHLILLARDVYHVAAHPAAHHGCPPSHSVVRGRELIRTNG